MPIGSKINVCQIIEPVLSFSTSNCSQPRPGSFISAFNLRRRFCRLLQHAKNQQYHQVIKILDCGAPALFQHPLKSDLKILSDTRASYIYTNQMYLRLNRSESIRWRIRNLYFIRGRLTTPDPNPGRRS